MASNNEIVKTLSFKVEGEQNMKSLKKEIKDLQDALLNVEKGGTEWEEIVKRLTDDQARYTEVLKAGKTQVEAASDSIVGMERQYKSLYDTYKLLSEEDRNNDKGREMAASLEQLHDKLNEAKMEVGNFKDNIGNYTKSAMDAFNKLGISVGSLQKPLQVASQGVGTFGKSLKALALNPVGMLIMATVVVFQRLKAIVDKVKEAINNNEESQMRLKEAMSAFQPVIDAIANAWDWLAQKVVGVIDIFGKAFLKIEEFGAKVTDFLHITDSAQETVKIYRELAKSQNELTKTKREYMKLNTADKAEVERLREEASETDNLNEKSKLLNEAKDKQAEIDKRNIALAEENLRVLKEEASLTANNAEMNEKLATAEAAVSQARADAAKNQRMLNRQLAGIDNSRAQAAKKIQDEANKIIQEINESTESERQKLEKELKEKKDALIAAKKDTTELEKFYEKKFIILALKEKQVIQASEDTLKQLFISIEPMPQQLINTIDVAEGKIKDFTDSIAEYFDIGTEGEKSPLENLVLNLSSYFGEMDTDKLDEFNAANGTSIKNFVELATLAKAYEIDLNKLKSSLGSYYIETQKITDEQSKIVNQSTISSLLYNFIAGSQDDIDEAKKKAYDDISAVIVEQKMSLEEYYAFTTELREDELKAIAKAAKDEWENYSGDLNEKLRLETEYYQAEAELSQFYLDAKLAKNEIEKDSIAELQDAYFNLGKSASDSLGSIIDSITQMTRATLADTKSQIENGKLSQKEIEKKKKNLKTLEGIQLAVAIAGIAADTASGIMGVWRGYGAEQVVNAQTAAATGPAAAATFAALQAKSLTMAGINTGIIAGAGAANLAAAIAGSVSNFSAINQLGAGDSGAGATAGATPAIIDATPYSYSRELQTDTEREEEINKPIWVSVRDIDSAQNKVRVVESETTF